MDVCFSLYYIYLVLHVLISTSFYFDWLYSLFLSVLILSCGWAPRFAFTNLYGKLSRIFTLSSFISFEIRKTKTNNLISLSWFETNFNSILWFINKWLGMKKNMWNGSLIHRLCISHNELCEEDGWEMCISLIYMYTKYDFISDIFWMNKMELMMIPKLYIYLVIYFLHYNW